MYEISRDFIVTAAGDINTKKLTGYTSTRTHWEIPEGQLRIRIVDDPIRSLDHDLIYRTRWLIKCGDRGRLCDLWKLFLALIFF